MSHTFWFFLGFLVGFGVFEIILQIGYYLKIIEFKGFQK